MEMWNGQVIKMLMWMVFIMVLICMAFINYRMKLERQAREGTMFYKIYTNLLEIDPNFDNNKNEMQRQFVIT